MQHVVRMHVYPVHYQVEQPRSFSPLQLLIRIIAFGALAIVGISLGGVFMFAYLALPLVAAVRISARGGAEYVQEDGPRIVGMLRWLGAIAAWVGLTTDRLPIATYAETVVLDVERTARPTAGSAMWRIVTGLPSAFVLSILCWFGVFVWLWAALTILFVRRVGDRTFGYLTGLQRWSARLLAYQASLVDEYPPFSFDAPQDRFPRAQVTGV